MAKIKLIDHPTVSGVFLEADLSDPDMRRAWRFDKNGDADWTLASYLDDAKSIDDVRWYGHLYTDTDFEFPCARHGSTG